MKHTRGRHRHFFLAVLALCSAESIIAWNPFNPKDWEDLGGEIINRTVEAGKWLGDQAVAVARELEKAVNWIGDQAKIAYQEAKSATETIYSQAIAPAGQFLEEAGKKTITAVKDGAAVVVDRFKDTKVTRGIDYAARIAVFEASKAVATGVLTAARETATGTLKVSRTTAEGVLKGAEGFLKEVAKPVASAVLKGSAEAAKGILEGAKQTSVGVLEGGKWVVNNALGQIDINKIHYDGNLRDFSTGKLGNVALEGKVIQDFSLRTSLDVNNVIDSLKPIINNIVEELKKIFVDPFTPQIAKINDNKKEVDEITKKLEGMNLPKESLYTLEELSKAENSWNIVSDFEQDLAQAKTHASTAEKTIISPEEFAKLKPEEKIAQANQLDAAAKDRMIAINVELLKKNKVCPGGYFENITLENLDLSTGILQGAVMVGVTLRNVNFSEATLSGITIIGSTITTCNFTKAKLHDALVAGTSPEQQTIITNSNFFQAELTGAHVNAQFNGCNLDEISGVGLQLKLSAIRETTLRKANLQWLEADMVIFSPNTQLTQADLRNAILIEVDLSQAILTQVHMENATVVYTRFSLARADGISLQGTNFVFGVSWRGANLAKAALSSETNFQGANLCQALMPDGTVNEADCKRRLSLHSWNLGDTTIVEDNRRQLLMHKKCRGCMLEGVDLRGVDLSGADLNKAWLVKADLRGTVLRNADLRGARLQGAKVDAATNFDGAQFCRTLMPDGKWSNDDCGKPEKEAGTTPEIPTPKPSPGEKGAPSALALRNAEKLETSKACPGCDLKNTLLAEKALQNVNLERANLSGADLSGSSLSGVNSNLKRATLQKATLVETDLSLSQLQEADFKGADMRYAILHKVNATDAKFFDAKLGGADLHQGIFTNANFSGAILTDVDVEGADFTGANFTGAQFIPRVFNGKSSADTALFCRTIMPDGSIRNSNCNK